MTENQPYQSFDISGELKRYSTPTEVLEFYVKHLEHSKAAYIISLGPRLLPMFFSVANEIVGVDIYQEVIDRCNHLMEKWSEYRDTNAFRRQSEFLEKKGLNVDFSKKHAFYLRKNLPQLEQGRFDSCSAIELLLHLSPEDSDVYNRPQTVFKEASSLLKAGGKLIFTVYPPSKAGQDEGMFLDEEFIRLGSKAGLSNEEVFDGDSIDIDKLVRVLKAETPEIFSKNLERLWLDLPKIRLYSPKEIEGFAKGKFKLVERARIPGGMFSFAERHVYAMEKM